MDRSLFSIKASLAKAIRQIYSRADSAFPLKRRRHLSEVQRFSHQVQGTLDSSEIGQALVSAITRGLAADRVLLYLPHPDQDRLVATPWDGVDNPHHISLQPSSPCLIWLGGQNKAVAAEEVQSLPQWQGVPTAEREALSALGIKLFLSVGTGSAGNALLGMGSRKGGLDYSQEEIKTLELLAHQAASALEIAHLRHRLDQQQQELRLARGQLASSTRMTAIGEALSASVQEIENSLRAISSLVEGISRDINEQSASRQTVEAMKTEAAHAHDALLPLLDLAHEGQENWSVQDLNSLLSSVVAVSGLNTTGSRVEVTLQPDPGDPRVWCVTRSG